MDTPPVKIFLLSVSDRHTVNRALGVVDMLERAGYVAGALFVA